MTPGPLELDVVHDDRLCLAMQHGAVPWLHKVVLRNRGADDLADLRLDVTLEPELAAPLVVHVAMVPAGGEVVLERLDPLLRAGAFANLVERQRADLRVRVQRGAEPIAEVSRPLAVLAGNEWPGLATTPALLAAFVQPNHPDLAPLLKAVGAQLAATTGRGELDAYQSGDPARVRAMLAAVHDATLALGVTYVTPPPSFERQGQKVRGPEQVLGERLATCLDLAVLQAAVVEHLGLRPLLVLLRDHAFVGAWLVDGSSPEPFGGLAVELQKRSELGALLCWECTAACGGGQPFTAAVATAERHLRDEVRFVGALDVAAARRFGFLPLPGRTAAFAPVAEPLPVPAAAATLPAPAAGATTAAPLPPAPAVSRPAPVRDRLEHWRSRLLDLTARNRLLHFVPTKKTVVLCDHDPAALEDRLQAGARLHVHARPALAGEADPRDPELLRQRQGRDVSAAWLADELQAGRLRADHDDGELATRLVEIFRHARSSLEETGANTLYLALGFLQWFETPQSEKPRRAPLLLLPLQCERLSVQEGFRFVLADAEPQLNRTLLAMLARDFDVHPGFGDAVPEDDQGLDVAAVFDGFRRAVVGLPRWRVETSAAIGFFAFTKYLMYLALADRQQLLQSPVLRHLVETPGAGFVQEAADMPREVLDDLDPATVFCPKDADSSQLAAVLSAARGRTFVLEGPPGTGKSQTITNLIAQSLAAGKRVLFVAEKRAALEVVQRRLAEVGLGPFCLELHSSKSGPKAVLAQLGRALGVARSREPAAWTQRAGELEVLRRQLNDYVVALHRPRPAGGSVFAAMAQLIELRDAERLPLATLDGAPAERVATARAAVAELASVGRELGVPAQEPWWGIGTGDFTPALVRQVAPLVQRLVHAAAALAAAAAAVLQSLGLAVEAPGPRRTQLNALRGLVAALCAPVLPPPALLLVADPRALDGRLRELGALGQERDRRWAALQPRWQPELLGCDLPRLLGVFTANADTFAPLRWWRLRGPRAELLAVARGPLAPAAAVAADLAEARAVLALDARLRLDGELAAALGPVPAYSQLPQFAQWLQDVRGLLLAFAPGAVLPTGAQLGGLAAALTGLAAGRSPLPAQLASLRSADDELTAALTAVDALLQLDPLAAFGPDDRPGWLGAVAERANRWLAAGPRLREHCAYVRAAAAATAAGGEALVQAHACGDLPTAALPAAFERSFLEAWLDGVHATEPLLARFRGRDHEASIARFRALDQELLRLAAEVVVARLAAQLPQVRDTMVASSELGQLERELKKQRRHKPVRTLFQDLPGLLGRLAPCLLMSPLSVAQFLGSNTPPFDLVVFDEASQIPMWDAAAAIGRGRALVCVGDSRQLPPTAFFQRLEGDEPPPDEVPEDLESVLDECAAAGLPRLHLDWHYRSRHESLIAFSNHHYYRNRLLTFPAPDGSGPGRGVNVRRVAGIYDRAGSRQNRVEAEALVAEVVARLRDPQRQRQSLGIVTFSQPQQVLVEDLLDRARAEHPELEPFFTAVAEPLFTKNLENVQGDERDVILFSIGYGPDQAGKIHENYGPLNQPGGERRLNVAVTRARRELLVFTSLGAEQVANRTAALGARHLRTFLDYAARGPAALAAATAADPSAACESPFEQAVRDALAARGHELHAQVGCSGYRIDLAVVDPAAPGRYLLGIECDGASYHAAATARDRDRLRAAVLQGLGWQLHRIWSTDWWQDPAGELARVEAAIAAAKQAAAAVPVERLAAATVPTTAVGETVAGAAEGVTPSPEVAPDAAEPPADPAGPRPFVAARLQPAAGGDPFTAAQVGVLRGLVAAALAAEAPVAFDRLAALVAAAGGAGRVTEKVRERIRAALPAAAVVDGETVWADAATRAAFTGFRVPADGAGAERDAEELPVVEVAAAMRWLLRQHQALAAADLCREAARCFGITRLGSVVKARMELGLAALVEAGAARREGELVRGG